MSNPMVAGYHFNLEMEGESTELKWNEFPLSLPAELIDTLEDIMDHDPFEDIVPVVLMSLAPAMAIASMSSSYVDDLVAQVGAVIPSDGITTKVVKFTLTSDKLGDLFQFENELGLSRIGTELAIGMSADRLHGNVSQEDYEQAVKYGKVSEDIRAHVDEKFPGAKLVADIYASTTPEDRLLMAKAVILTTNAVVQTLAEAEIEID